MKQLQLGVALLIAVAVVANAATSTSSIKLFLADNFNVGTELVAFNGTVHVVVQSDVAFPGDSYLPGDPYRVQINLLNVVGVATTGATYQLIGAGIANGFVAADSSIDVTVEGFVLRSSGQPFVRPTPIRLIFFTDPVFGITSVHLWQ